MWICVRIQLEGCETRQYQIARVKGAGVNAGASGSGRRDGADRPGSWRYRAGQQWVPPAALRHLSLLSLHGLLRSRCKLIPHKSVHIIWYCCPTIPERLGMSCRRKLRVWYSNGAQSAKDLCVPIIKPGYMATSLLQAPHQHFLAMTSASSFSFVCQPCFAGRCLII